MSSEVQGYFFQVANTSTLTFNSGNYKAGSAIIVRLGVGATATVNGGAFETTTASAIAFAIEGNNSTFLNINGGRFKAYSADRPNIRYRVGKINITDFDPADGILCISHQSTSTEAVAISSFVTLVSDGLMITDTEGKEITEITGNKQFRVAPVHEVKYDLNGGSSSTLASYKFPVPKTISVPTFDMVTPPSGKVLSHWEVNGTRYEEGGSVQITTGGTTTLKAIWQDQVMYNVTLHANNGTSNKITSQEWSLYTLPAQLPDGWTVREGYYFAGWSETTTGTAMTGQVKLKGDTDFYAIFNRMTYPVSYIAEGATNVPSNQTKVFATALVISSRVPEKEGYDFMGWEDRESGTIYQPGDFYRENKAMTLYAVWKLKTYEVSFVAEGATNVPENQTKSHGVTLKISEQKPHKEGYIFIGWALAADGVVAYKAGADYTENNAKTFYAIWVPAEFAVMSYDSADKTATVVLLEAGTYTVVFVDYEGNKFANFECVPLTVSEEGVATASITKNFALDAGDKIMLWHSMTDLSPLCEAYTVE